MADAPVQTAAPTGTRTLMPADPNAAPGAPVAAAPLTATASPYDFQDDNGSPEETVAIRNDGTPIRRRGYWFEIASKTPVAWAVVQTYQAKQAAAKPAGTTGAAGGGMGDPSVGAADTASALDQYRTGITKGQATYDSILNPRDQGGMPVNDPNARDTFTPVVGGDVTAQTIASGTGRLRAAQIEAPTAAPVSTVDAQNPTRTRAAVAAGAISPALVSPAQRLQAATQRATTVDGTTLDTSQADQARSVADQNIADLQATARGQGAGQLAADARTRADIGKLGQTLQGAARTARGSERKGALIGATLAAAEQGANALVAREAQSATERMGAQSIVGQQAQQTRSTDLQAASKRADLQAQRSTLQAQLDAARAAGDAGRTQEITTKMADLDQQVAALNAGATNTANEAAAGRSTTVSLANAAAANQNQSQNADRSLAADTFSAGARNTAGENDAARRLAAATTNATSQNDVEKFKVGVNLDTQKFNSGQDVAVQTGNVDRGIGVAQSNNQQGLAANVAGSNQDVEQARLRMDAQAAIEKSAKGLLDENERQNHLAIARQQIELAKQRGDREAEQSWFDKASALLTTGAKVAATVAPLLAASDRTLKKDIKPIKEKDLGELAKALRGSLATWSYKEGEGLPAGEQVGPMAQDIQKTKLGKLAVVPRDDGKLMVDYPKLSSMLAAHNLTERKRRSA